MILCYQRGLLYLARKPAKSLLLFLAFLLVNTMLLGTTMVLRATQETQAAMEGNTKAKVVWETSGSGGGLTEEAVAALYDLPFVVSVNRMGQKAARLPDCTPVTGSLSTQEENQMVSLLSFDDLEADGPFADGAYRLVEGELFLSGAEHSAVVNADFARENGLGLGDTLRLEGEGETTVTILGAYLAGSEAHQGKDTPALHRVENQIYLDQRAYGELFGTDGLYQCSVYTSQPAALDQLARQVREILGEQGRVTTSDALYQQMKAPLSQIGQVVSLMRLLTFAAGALLVSLLLCLWMRGRQREMAVFLSLGESKRSLFLQGLLESALLFFLALLAACGVGGLAAGRMGAALSASVSSAVALALQGADVVLAAGLGGLVVGLAVCLSLLPVLRAKPKEVLSRMEG